MKIIPETRRERTWWRLFQSFNFERTWWRLFQKRVVSVPDEDYSNILALSVPNEDYSRNVSWAYLMKIIPIF
jgi:hypothetical protein